MLPLKLLAKWLNVILLANAVSLCIQIWMYVTNKHLCSIQQAAVTSPPDDIQIRDAWKWNRDWDSIAQVVPHATPAKTRIVLVRHGEYFWDGEKMGHLTPRGERQAHLTGQRLKVMNITFHEFIASTAVRTTETADIIHRYINYIDIERTHLIKEGRPLVPEPPFTFWDEDEKQYATDGARIGGGFEKYIHRAHVKQDQNRNVLIVAHGNVIGYFVLRALQLPPERWLKMSVHQGSITILDIPPNGEVMMRSFGDVGHIPYQDWTG